VQNLVLPITYDGLARLQRLGSVVSFYSVHRMSDAGHVNRV